MLNLTKRVHKLLEKTSSLDTQSVCKEVMEMYTTVPEEQLAESLIEKLKAVKDSDKYVSSFVQVAEKYLSLRDLGISKAISGIRESQSYHYQTLRYVLDKFERAKVSEGMQDYLMVEDFMSSLKDFTWDKNVSDSLQSIKEKFEANKENVIVSRALYEFKRAKGNFLYESLCQMLEDHFENPTQASRSAIIESLQKFSYSPVAKVLSENLKKIQAANGKGLQIIAENGACSVLPVYSTILLENGKEYFSVKGDVYRKSNAIIEKVTATEFESLSENIKRSYQIFNSPYFFVKEGKASFYIGKNKVEIFESANGKQVSYNGKSIPGGEIAKNLMSTGMLRLEEAKVASDIQFVNDIFENFFELDFAKVITSKLYEGSYVTLMKENDKIYLNKVNSSMNTNEFFSEINVTQARNLILEFIGYDIKQSLVEFIEKDEAEMRAIREQQLEVLKNLTIVEGEIFKVESAKQDAYLASTPQIKTLEETLRKELENLKAQYTVLSEKLKKFESASSDARVEPGQDIRVSASGARATVKSVNSNENSIDVVTTDGEALTLKNGDYETLEDDKDAAIQNNDERSETESDRVETEERPEGLEDDQRVEEELSVKQKALPPEMQKEILKKQGEEEKEKVEEANEIVGGGIIAGGNEVPVDNVNKDDFPTQEPEEPTEEVTEYVKAKVSDDQGGSCAGQEVEILATDYASKGDADLVQVKSGEDIFFIEKKFLQVATDEADDSLTIDFDAKAPGEEEKKDDEEEKKDDGEEISAAEKPAEEPSSDSPAEDTSTEEKPLIDTPAEAPAEDKPAEEAPAEDKPAEDKPAEEAPAEDKPAEEAPAEDKPAEDKPAEDKPAEEAPAEEPKSDDEDSKSDVPKDTPPEDKSEEDMEDDKGKETMHTINSLHKKLKRALRDLEDIKTDMKDTFTSNEAISTTINGLRGLVEALDKDVNEATQ